MKRILKIWLFLLLPVFACLLVPVESEAMPFFARRISKDCTFCHTFFPKLKETGRVFRSNGYRFAEEAGEGVWKDVKDWKNLPVSIEVEVEGVWNSLEKSGVKTKESDVKVEEVELLSGGPLGRSGRVSYLAVAGVEQESSGDYEAFLGSAFIQINDLLGPTGHGRVNFRAGQWAMALPFLGHDQRVVKNRYLAQKTLNVLTGDQRAIELNGSVVAPEESSKPTHRYSLGITREDVGDSDKLKGYYATYALTFVERYSLGLIYRHTEEASGGKDVEFDKFGIAGEAYVGPVNLTLGYFDSSGEGDEEDLGNYMAEVLFVPFKNAVLGARYDVVTEDGKDDAEASTLTARYNILSSVFAHVEYRHLTDDDHITSGNEEEDRVRLFLVGLF
jgi:hypothetical protein